MESKQVSVAKDSAFAARILANCSRISPHTHSRSISERFELMPVTLNAGFGFGVGFGFGDLLFFALLTEFEARAAFAAS